ncbi:glycosyltransferase family 4 protein [Thiobacillus sp.]|uniref:glycosyltransferase family 4 protein n=1 Tax=Thiobacillus sp. TaxID=924 RepID=UPI001AC895B2|nr:glycosyltransferase family 4 protein [Thiobacillus sp.]MBN8777996.1 glycosyltransferase family 4 protein [Thiobacillus sp.]
MRVAFLGLRGFPDVQGGVETHAEHLCPLLVELGCEVDVIVRAPYQPESIGDEWKGIRFHRLWAPRSKGLEAILHTGLGVLYAGFVRRPDVLHVQAIGPALMVPLARLLGLRVVVTHHGPDYDRQKWGYFARLVLRLGERFGMRWSNDRIVISEVIRSLVKRKHGRDSTLIPNGVVLPEMPDTMGALVAFGLDPGKYVLLVSRLVPEKRHLDLIEAFQHAALPGWKLAIVGASDHPDAYVRKVLDAAAATPGVVCTGLQTGLALRELYTHAGIFVLPSSHEGLPIAMLEALSYGLPVVASDIPANLEVGLSAEHYFPLGDVAALAAHMRDFAAQTLTVEARESRRAWVSGRFDWKDIARRTLEVYQTVVYGAKHGG